MDEQDQQALQHIQNLQQEILERARPLYEIHKQLITMNIENERNKIISLLHLKKQALLPPIPQPEVNIKGIIGDKDTINRKEVYKLMKAVNIPNKTKRQIDLEKERGLIINGRKIDIYSIENQMPTIEKEAPELAKELKHLLKFEKEKEPDTKGISVPKEEDMLSNAVYDYDRQLTLGYSLNYKNLDYGCLSMTDDALHISLDDTFRLMPIKEYLFKVIDKRLKDMQEYYEKHKKQWNDLRAPYTDLLMLELL